MGKTPKPLDILVDITLADTPEVIALAAKGHTITVTTDSIDLILHPKAWRMQPELLKYLDVAIKGARAERYGKKEKPDDDTA